MSTPTTLGISHVGLTVRDLAQTVTFFVDILGFKQVGGKPDYPSAFISDGACVLTLWQAKRPDSAGSFDRANQIGLHHLALNVSPETLDRLGEQLLALPKCDVEFSPELSGAGPARHMMVAIPGSAIRLELRSDR